MLIKNEGCEKCEEAKQAMLLLSKIGFSTSTATICLTCETIWRLSD